MSKNENEHLYAGIFAALLMPMRTDFSIDIDTLVSHVNDLLANGCQGAAIFGTTGEAPHITVEEKKRVLTSVIEKGISPKRLIVGVGHCSIEDTLEMIHAALNHEVLAVLWHPPFYYKNLPDAGIISFYKECLDRINDKSRLKVVLYNFPTLTGVELTHNIVAQLYSLYPSNIMGIKDSGCNFEHTLAYVEKFPQLKIYAGKDTDTSELVRRGAVGGIGSLANFIPNLMRSLYEYGKDKKSIDRNGEINRLVPIIDKHWPICSMKAIMAIQTNNEQWNRARPPFHPLTWDEGKELVYLMRQANINK